MVRALLPALLSLLLAGCPGSRRLMDPDGGDSDVDADGDGDGDSDIDAGPDASPRPRDAGWDWDVWVDPGCADAGPPPTDYECDLYDEDACGPGMACYPYIFYPADECQEEGYGSLCDVAGFGTEDVFCDSAYDCAAGFACFQSAEGRRCLQLCPLIGESDCPPGRICAPTDVPGMGACF